MAAKELRLCVQRRVRITRGRLDVHRFLEGLHRVLSLLLAAVFAGLAAWFAYRVPRNVAELAAELDLRNRGNDRRSQVKLILFGTLMQERANIASREGVGALNLIDVAFFDDRGVRDAWAEYGEPIAYDAADRIKSHGISPADAARVWIAVGIGGLRIASARRAQDRRRHQVQNQGRARSALVAWRCSTLFILMSSSA